jgi:hypothetical protein
MLRVWEWMQFGLTGRGEVERVTKECKSEVLRPFDFSPNHNLVRYADLENFDSWTS